MAGEQLMTVPEFGRRLRVSRSSAYDIVAAGLVDWVDVSTGKTPAIRISESALKRYLAARERKGAKTSERAA